MRYIDIILVISCLDKCTAHCLPFINIEVTWGTFWAIKR